MSLEPTPASRPAPRCKPRPLCGLRGPLCHSSRGALNAGAPFGGCKPSSNGGEFGREYGRNMGVNMGVNMGLNMGLTGRMNVSHSSRCSAKLQRLQPGCDGQRSVI